MIFIVVRSRPKSSYKIKWQEERAKRKRIKLNEEVKFCRDRSSTSEENDNHSAS